MPKQNVVDLFSGTGAFSLVFNELANFEVVFANDFDKSSKENYDINFDHKLVAKNLNKIKSKNIPKHDILCGGFPCQSFSIAGLQKGFDDERANVFDKIIDIMKTHKPKVVMFENVKNLESHDKGNTFKIIKEKLEKVGYKIKHKILNTCEYTDIPQNRERIFILCFKNKKDYNNFSFDNIKLEKKTKKIKTILEKNIDSKYYYTESSKIYDKLKKDVTKSINDDVVYQYRRYYVRENKSGVCPTLTANMGTGGHNVPIIKDNKGIRKLTPRECFNLQGFPEDYKLNDKLSDSKLYKLAGNAVSVPMVRKIINEVKKLF